MDRRSPSCGTQGAAPAGASADQATLTPLVGWRSGVQRVDDVLVRLIDHLSPDFECRRQLAALLRELVLQESDFFRRLEVGEAAEGRAYLGIHLLLHRRQRDR